MENLYKKENGRYEVMGGSQINTTISEAIAEARRRNREITFEFNGVDVTVTGDSDHKLILRDWDRALNGYIDKAVKPNPAAELTHAEIQSDAHIEEKNELRRRESRKRYDDEAATKSKLIQDRLVNTPAMELVDEEGWQKFKDNNTDPYGGAVVTYSERWARLMQVEVAAGKPLADIADATSQEADLEGITGFMYGCAVSTLAKVWKHGEELRRWHNIKTQIRDEGQKANDSGGVLNPALLSVGKA